MIREFFFHICIFLFYFILFYNASHDRLAVYQGDEEELPSGDEEELPSGDEVELPSGDEEKLPEIVESEDFVKFIYDTW